MSKVEKRILKAAKQNMVTDLELRIAESVEKKEKMLDYIENNSPGSEELEANRRALQLVCTTINSLVEELNELKKKKTSRRALKSSLEWKLDPKDLRNKVKESSKVVIRDNEALSRVQSARSASQRMQYGDWLIEGALVKHKSSTAVLLVLAMRGNRVEVLDGATRKIMRATTLRPFETDDD